MKIVDVFGRNDGGRVGRDVSDSRDVKERIVWYGAHPFFFFCLARSRLQ